MDNKLMFSSKTVEWETPQNLFDYLDGKFHFTLDPCCHEKTTKCKKFYTKEDDGLSKSWKHEIVFMNPPYGREIGKWIRKAYEEGIKTYRTVVVALVPARTDTKWWHDYCMFAFEIYLIKGRLKFNKWQETDDGYCMTQNNQSAPFPSAIVVFDWTLEDNPDFKSLSKEEFE